MDLTVYKQGLQRACALYRDEIKSQHKCIHPARLQDLNVFETLITHMDEPALLNLKLIEHLEQMSTRGRIWTLYLLSHGHSRLRQLIKEVMDYYGDHEQINGLKKIIQHQEQALARCHQHYDKVIERIQAEKNQALLTQQQANDQLVGQLKAQIHFLMDENKALKNMLAKQNEIIQAQLDQILNLHLSTQEQLALDGAQETLKAEFEHVQTASVFSVQNQRL